jgi:hypothetical protein
MAFKIKMKWFHHRHHASQQQQQQQQLQHRNTIKTRLADAAFKSAGQ